MADSDKNSREQLGSLPFLFLKKAADVVSQAFFKLYKPLGDVLGDLVGSLVFVEILVEGFDTHIASVGHQVGYGAVRFIEGKLHRCLHF